jgi:hypothetical protein
MVVRNQVNRPFHNLATLKKLAEEGKVQFGNQSAQRDAKTLDFDQETIRRFILCLRPDHFLKPYPQQKCFNGRAQLDCDAYKMNFNGKELCEDTSAGDLIFAKLGIHLISGSEKVAVISFHLDR